MYFSEYAKSYQSLNSFDTSGVVFGVLCQDTRSRHSLLKLYDARQFDSGPFDNIFPSKETFDAAFNNINSLGMCVREYLIVVSIRMHLFVRIQQGNWLAHIASTARSDIGL